MRGIPSEKAINSVVVVNGDSTELKIINQFLTSEQYEVVGMGRDSFDTVKMTRQFKPDILVVDAELPNFDCVNVSKNLTKEGYSKGIIFIVNKLEETDLFRLQCEHLLSIVERPLTKTKMMNAVQIGEIYLNNIYKLSKKLKETEQKLSDRKKIDFAKGILIDHFKLSEADAYRYIQKESMSKQITMADIAEVIILTHA